MHVTSFGAATLADTEIAIINHFQYTMLPAQKVNTYADLAKAYWDGKNAGLTDNQILTAIENNLNIFITGNRHTVAAGVVAAMKMVETGQQEPLDKTPAWSEVFSDYGVDTKAWYAKPAGLALIAAGIYFLPGMLGRFFRGARK